MTVAQPIELVPGTPRMALADLVLRRSDLANLPQPEEVIKDTLDARTVAVLRARGGGAKTFLALDWSCCIATGKAWQGRAVLLPGPVLYVAAEGAFGLHARVSAWEHAWGRTADTLDVLPLAVNLYTGVRFGELHEMAKARQYRLVVIDTWARSTVGGRENDNSDSTQAFERVDRLRQSGTTVLVLAHTDAGDTKTRGATALEDNADTVYGIKGDPQSVAELRREKRKDGPLEDVHQLRLKPVLDSCVLENVRGQNVCLNARSEELLSVFLACFPDGCSRAELRNVADQASATFARSLGALVTTGRLENVGTDKRPFYKKTP